MIERVSDMDDVRGEVIGSVGRDNVERHEDGLTISFYVSDENLKLFLEFFYKAELRDSND